MRGQVWRRPVGEETEMLKVYEVKLTKVCRAYLCYNTPWLISL